MKQDDSDQYPAFVWCRNKGDDWYLPAVYELEAIYKNKSVINSTLAEHGGTALSDDGWYWSSTEYADNAEFCAWSVYMYYGLAYNYGKLNGIYVRAVSAF